MHLKDTRMPNLNLMHIPTTVMLTESLPLFPASSIATQVKIPESVE